MEVKTTYKIRLYELTENDSLLEYGDTLEEILHAAKGYDNQENFFIKERIFIGKNDETLWKYPLSFFMED